MFRPFPLPDQQDSSDDALRSALEHADRAMRLLGGAACQPSGARAAAVLAAREQFGAAAQALSHEHTTTGAERAPSPPHRPVRVRVFHNVASEAARTGYRVGHVVVEVFSYSTTSTLTAAQLAEQTFRVCTIDDGPDPDVRTVGYQRHATRSLVAGDVIAVGERFYARTGFGTTTIITPPRIHRVHRGTPAQP
ncbi:hypothetical protein LZ318_30810 [Saccharopolyspora indica]|uniref:hypothetical protein n=1 Tax=Saccharopolyspora indica TaxID=1229659 RepID=UPI0022EA5BE5|nr:hypothetical protein [Saccharopolyspora indica]MDA3644376.1 hypothetical protein [Saccharopolyspora indica]